MKLNQKILPAALSLSILCGNIVFINTASAEEGKGYRIFEINMDEQNVGEILEGGMTLNGTPVSDFKIIEVDESISPSGKAVSCNTSSGVQSVYEVYFDADNPISFDVSEGTHYYIKLKARVPKRNGTFRSDLQSKISLFNKELAPQGNAGRANLNGFEYRSEDNLQFKIGSSTYVPQTIKGETWYNILYDIYAATDPSDRYMKLSVYDIGETAPDKWQCGIDASSMYDGATATTMAYNTAIDVDFIGVKAYNSLIDFTDYSAYAYSDSDVEEYNALAERINTLKEGIENNEYTSSDAKLEIEEAAKGAGLFNGILSELLNEKISTLYTVVSESEAAFENAKSVIESIKNASISTDNFMEYYMELTNAKEKLADSVFSEEAEEYINELFALEAEKIAPVLSEFNIYDDFEQEDGAVAKETGEGWEGGWSAIGTPAQIQNGRLVLNGPSGVKRKLQIPINITDNLDYYISWDMKASSDGTSGINIADNTAGISVGKHLFVNGTRASQTIEGENENTYLARLSKRNDNVYLSIKTVGDNRNAALEYAAEEVTDGFDAPDTVSLYSTSEGDVSIDNINIRIVPKEYTESIEKCIDEWQLLSFENEEDFDTAVELESTARQQLALIPDSIIKTDLKAVIDNQSSKTQEIRNNFLNTKADLLIDKLNNRLSREDIDKLTGCIAQMSDGDVKNNYQKKAEAFEAEFRRIVPVIDSVGIDGNIAVGSTVSAKVSVSDPYGIGCELEYAWYYGGKVISTASFAAIGSGGGTLYVNVTPKNSYGVYGESKSSTKTNVYSSGSVSSAGSGGGGGGGGSHSTYNGSKATEAPRVPAEESSNTNISETENNDIQTDSINSFADIDSHWAKEYITRMYEKNIVNGVTDKLFEPNRNITRAEFVKLVVSALEIDSDGAADMFDDVTAEDWFADYVMTASSKGIVSGFNGRFRPNDSITREEAVKIIVEGYKCAGGEINPSDEVNVFNDNDTISDWASEYVNNAAAMAIINGDDNGNFNPNSMTTRAEAVVMLSRVMENLNYKGGSLND